MPTENTLLNKETISGFKYFHDTDTVEVELDDGSTEERDLSYIALWVTHEVDGETVETPVIEYTNGLVLYDSSDPEFVNTEDTYELGDDFLHALGTALLVAIEEPVFEIWTTFLPDDIEVSEQEHLLIRWVIHAIASDEVSYELEYLIEQACKTFDRNLEAKRAMEDIDDAPD